MKKLRGWLTREGQTGFAPARSLKVSVSGHGQWETLHFPVGTHPQWKGKGVTHLRIDPINQAGAKFSIESAKASKRDRAGVKTSNSEAQAASRTDRPNFLILLTDDQRFDTIGVNQPGLAIRTPAIDRLAKEGMNFSQGFVTTPICAVSRASILSGRYSRNADIHCFLIPFSKEVFPTTYPAVLKEQGGYFIGQLGKYGVGATAQQQAYFDFFDGDLAQGESFKDYRGQKLHDSEWLTRRTGDFLDAVPEGQPFALQVNYKAPHPSAAVAPEDVGSLAGVSFDPMPTDTAKDGATVPFEVRRGLGGHSYAGDFGTPERRDRWIGQYLEKIISVDRSVGNIVAMLEARGLDQNTVIVFLSDHGTHFGEKQLTGKWTPYDPSLHIPFIIYDPRATATAGSTDHSLVLNIDVAPTLVDLAGLAVPAEMDGRSIAPLLRGEAPADWRTHFFYEHQTSPATIPRPIPRSMGVRTETAKYVLWSDATPPVEEYYDLSRDPLERFNRLQEQAPAAARLRNLFQQWERDNPDTYTHMPYTHRPQSGAPEIDWDKLKAALPTHFRRIEAEVKRRGVTWDDAFNDPQLRWEIGVAAQYFY